MNWNKTNILKPKPLKSENKIKVKLKQNKKNNLSLNPKNSNVWDWAMRYIKVIIKLKQTESNMLANPNRLKNTQYR